MAFKVKVKDTEELKEVLQILPLKMREIVPVKWVEYGSSRMVAHSFLRTALILCRSLFTSIINQGITEVRR